MLAIISILLELAKIAEKAIYWRPFWNSLIPFKIWKFLFISICKVQNLRVYMAVKIYQATGFYLKSFCEDSDYINKKLEEMRI